MDGMDRRLRRNDERRPLAPESIEPMERREYDAALLMRRHPPFFRSERKLFVFSIACPQDAVHSGRLEYTRWEEMQLPKVAEPGRAADLVQARAGYYDYRPLPVADGSATRAAATRAPTVEWHVNFADPALFGYYGGAAMAQDELQVAEHPALAALRQALLSEGRTATTVYAGRPTPVLVAGAERRIHLNTEPNAAEGRPDGLYGRPFHTADYEAIRRAVEIIDPPTSSNVIAMAAPVFGHGRYTLDQISFSIATAYTGFRAARLESDRIAGPGAQLAIHTGRWGCGAFGGNPRVMDLVQVLAAGIAGVDRLVYYTGEATRTPTIERTLETARTAFGSGPVPARDLAAAIAAMGIEWGTGDGT
jgi:hypothetical protein